MPADPPINFEALAKSGGNSATGGYPYQIKAADLMRNFVFATLDADPSLIEQTAGQGGHAARKLKIPAAPSSGTHVLGAVDGALQWIATEEC